MFPSGLGPLAGRACLAAVLFWTAGTATGERPARLSPEKAKALWAQAREAQEAGEPARALGLVQKLLRFAPDNPHYIEAQAQAYAGLDDYAKEAASWEIFITVTPTPTNACPQLGRAYQKLGRAEQAVAAHRRCLALNPSQPDLHLFLALALERSGEAAEAKAHYEQVLRLAPGYQDARLGLARILRREGAGAEAQRLVEEVLKAQPGSVDALLAGAQSAEAAGRLDRAHAMLSAAVEKSPDYADLYRILARVCAKQKDEPCARQARAALSRLEPAAP